MNRSLACGLAAMLLTVPVAAEAADWVPAWSASPQPVWDAGFLFPTGVPATLADRTIRQVARLGFGGARLRIRLSNVYGRHPVRIETVHVARSAGGAAIGPDSDRPLTFGGDPAAVLPPGASVLSDPVAMPVEADEDIAVSAYFKDDAPVETFHWEGRRDAYLMPGAHAAEATFKGAETTTLRLFLSDILVNAPQARGTVVVMGDSITDGAGATMNAETRWPDLLAARAAPMGIAVVNAGISGARLLGDRMGANALARLDRDVLAQPKARALILMLGINDIAWPGTPFAPDEPPMTLERLTWGYRQVAEQARARGLRVIGATLSPFAGALPGTPLGTSYFSAAKDRLRVRVNDWMRTSGVFDAVLDVDRLLDDPARPGHLRSAFDCGDHLHPGDAGNEAIANAVDLSGLIVEKP